MQFKLAVSSRASSSKWRADPFQIAALKNAAIGRDANLQGGGVRSARSPFAGDPPRTGHALSMATQREAARALALVAAGADQARAGNEVRPGDSVVPFFWRLLVYLGNKFCSKPARMKVVAWTCRKKIIDDWPRISVRDRQVTSYGVGDTDRMVSRGTNLAIDDSEHVDFSKRLG